jgi:hypothetical protein
VEGCRRRQTFNSDGTGLLGRGISGRNNPRSLSSSGLPRNKSFLLPKREMAIPPFIDPVIKGASPCPSPSVSMKAADLSLTISTSTFPITHITLHYIHTSQSHTSSPRSSTPLRQNVQQYICQRFLSISNRLHSLVQYLRGAPASVDPSTKPTSGSQTADRLWFSQQSDMGSGRLAEEKISAAQPLALLRPWFHSLQPLLLNPGLLSGVSRLRSHHDLTNNPTAKILRLELLSDSARKRKRRRNISCDRGGVGSGGSCRSEVVRCHQSFFSRICFCASYEQFCGL